MKQKVFDSKTTITLVCMLIGSVIRVLYCLKYPVPVRDSFVYKLFVEEWIARGEIPEERILPPLGMFFFKEAYLVGKYDIIKNGIVLNVVFGLIIISILIRICSCLTKSNLAITLSGIVAATHPTLVRYSCQMTRENSYLLFFCMTAYFLLILLKRKWDIIVPLLSFFSAAAFLCRYEGLELFFICLGGVVFTFWKKGTLVRNIFLYMSLYVISIMLITHLISVSMTYYISYMEIFKMKSL